MCLADQDIPEPVFHWPIPVVPLARYVWGLDL